VLIRILPVGTTDPELEAWAAEAVRRFGSDRVVVERFSGVVQQ
jgi:hypothetical protein